MGSNCSSLTKVTIGESVTTIGAVVFYNTSIAEVDIPDSVTTIRDYAFQDCKNLNSVKIGNKVETIGYGAFERTSLTQVVIPDSVITISDQAFDENVKLRFTPFKIFFEKLGKYNNKVTFYIDRNYVYDSIYYTYNKYKIFNN